MTSEHQVQKMQSPFQETPLKSTGSQNCTSGRQSAAADRRKRKHFCNQRLAKPKKPEAARTQFPQPWCWEVEPSRQQQSAKGLYRRAMMLWSLAEWNRFPGATRRNAGQVCVVSHQKTVYKGWDFAGHRATQIDAGRTCPFSRTRRALDNQFRFSVLTLGHFWLWRRRWRSRDAEAEAILQLGFELIVTHSHLH